MPLSVHLPPHLIKAIDDYAAGEAIGSRQQAIVVLLAKALEGSGHLDHVPQEGTRPEDLTTANDD